jgi:hypothetical protein
VAVSCGQNSANHAASGPVVKDTTRHKVQAQSGPEDTLNITIGRPQIIAYCLSQPEYDSLSSEGRSEYDESFSDFINDVQEYDKGKHSGIGVSQTGSRFIHIKDTVIDRKLLAHNDFGLIFVNKSGEVQIFQGMLSLAEIKREVRNFLGRNTSAIVDKLLSACRSLAQFERLRENDPVRYGADSIFVYNKAIADIITNAGFRQLGVSDLKRISDSSKIEILSSKDRKLQIFSWEAENPYPTPPMCSNIAIIDDKTTHVISLNGTGDNDFADNLSIDTIIQLSGSVKTGYLLIGSNKCGNLCEQSEASVYSILNNELKKNPGAFLCSGQYFDDVEFHYLINDKISSEPRFQINDLELTCPLFSGDRTKQSGVKKYKIIL